MNVVFKLTPTSSCTSELGKLYRKLVGIGIAFDGEAFFGGEGMWKMKTVSTTHRHVQSNKSTLKTKQSM